MRGGARRGAGRKRVANPKLPIGGIRLPKDLYEIYQKQPKKNEFIINAVRAYTEGENCENDEKSKENEPTE